MKLRALSGLVAAIEEGSLRSAARRLDLSQPALTKLIRELETEVGASVLQRSTGGVFPTAQGKALYDHARRILHEVDEAKTEIDQLSGRMTGELTIAGVPLSLVVLIPEAMRTFCREYPDIQLRLREELYIAHLELLRSGVADIAVGPIPGGLPIGEFEAEPLMPIELAVIAGRDNPLAEATSLKQLAGARWVYTSLTGKSSYARMLFERNGLTAPPAAAIANSTLAMAGLISQGDYIGLMPMKLARHPAAGHFLKVVPIEEGPLEMTLGAIVRRQSSLKPSVRHFITHLQQAVQRINAADAAG